MNISRSNYEIYMIDFLDGKLNQPETDLFMQFLEANPDLQDELIDIRDAKIEPSSVRFNSKKILKKSEILNFEGNLFEEECIAYIENDLNLAQKSDFINNIREDSNLVTQYKQFKQTKFIADKNIQFTNKNSLKKRETTGISRKILYMVSSAAATVIIAVSFLFVFQNTSKIENTFAEADFDSLMKQKIKAEQLSIEKSILSQMKLLKPPVIVAEARNRNSITVTPIVQTNELVAENKREIQQPIEIISKEIQTVKVNSIITTYTQPILYATNYQQDNFSEYKSIPNYFKNQIAEGINSLEFPKEKVNLFSFLKRGLEGLGRLTETDVKLDKEFNENGDLTAYVYTSDLISFRREVKK